MPAISVADFVLPEAAHYSAIHPPKQPVTPESMIKAAFDALVPWFRTIVPTIEAQWKIGVTPRDDRSVTELRFSKLVGDANFMGQQLIEFVNAELNPKPRLTIAEFKLPSNATTRESYPPPTMVSNAFAALNPWFESIVLVIKPCYARLAGAHATPLATAIRLRGLASTVNGIKTLFVRFVNEEIAKKEHHGRKFSALVGPEDDSEAEISSAAALRFMNDYLDVEIGENEPPIINEDVGIELDDDF